MELLYLEYIFCLLNNNIHFVHFSVFVIFNLLTLLLFVISSPDMFSFDFIIENVSSYSFNVSIDIKQGQLELSLDGADLLFYCLI